MSNDAKQFEQRLSTSLGETVFGVEPVIHILAVALIARGHVLLEGPPGVGKTLLARTLSRALGGEFKRIQGTADLMPSDIIGVHVFDTEAGRFSFHPGPLFADVLLMDEVNRAGPKTQSALLEAMEERQVSIDRDNFPLPANFFVIATQNPHEFEGTYPLPESQLDRFLIRAPMEHPARDAEMRVVREYDLPQAMPTMPESAIDDGALDAARRAVAEVHLSDELIAYSLDVAAATRNSEKIELGLSTRGVLALVRCARIEAALRGGDFVVPDDRLVLTPEAALDGVSADDEVRRIVDAVPVNL